MNVATGAPTLRQIERKAKECGECGARFGEDGVFCPFDGQSLRPVAAPAAREVGLPSRVGGRYDVVEPLGEGGMGTVFRVRHVSLDRAFALKLLRRDLAQDRELADRFVQEARATARIRHPAIVSISDFGVLDDGVPWFVMEHLAGKTLAALLREAGPLPVARVVTLGKRIADGLIASHEAGVIHRDLKPENVFVLDDDEVRIVDFGAAKVIGASKLTRPGIVFGTPYYMSPEQASGLALDGRADVYSLGVLLYELVTGRVPFEADTYMGVLTKHLYESPPRPIAPDGASLGALGGVILRALEKEAGDRHASMAELRSALDAIATSERLPVTRRATRTAPLVLGEPSAADRIARSVELHERAEASRRRRLWGGAVVGALATVAVGVGAIALLAPASSPPPVMTPPPPPTTSEPAAAPSPSVIVTVAPPEPPASAPPPPVAEPSPPRVAAARPRPVATVSATSAAVPASVTAPPPAPTPRSLGEPFPDPWK